MSPDALGGAVARLCSPGLLDGDALTTTVRDIRDDIEAAAESAQHRAIEAIGANFDDAVNRLAAWSSTFVD